MHGRGGAKLGYVWGLEELGKKEIRAAQPAGEGGGFGTFLSDKNGALRCSVETETLGEFHQRMIEQNR